jgi:hypothetical protein
VVVKRNNKGQWVKGQSGNPNGRAPKPEVEELRKAIKAVEEQKDKKLLEHFVERAYRNDAVLVALIKKFIPDKAQQDISFENPPKFTVEIVNNKDKGN